MSKIPSKRINKVKVETIKTTSLTKVYKNRVADKKTIQFEEFIRIHLKDFETFRKNTSGLKSQLTPEQELKAYEIYCWGSYNSYLKKSKFGDSFCKII